MLPRSTKPIISLLLVVVALFVLVPRVEATTENRYMTNINFWAGSPLKKLNLNMTGSSSGTVLSGLYDGSVYVTQYLGVKVFLNHSDSSLTEITSGVTDIVSASTSGLKSGTWSCPQTDMSSDDQLQIEVWLSDADPPSTLVYSGLAMVEDSPPYGLHWALLNSATWTFYLYLLRTYTGGLTRYYFAFGSGSYNSHIENIVHDENPPQQTWNPVESWTGQLFARDWLGVEDWNGILNARMWSGVEVWNGSLVTKMWQNVESWSGLLISRMWREVEAWSGLLSGLGWHFVDSWLGELTQGGVNWLPIAFFLLLLMPVPLLLFFLIRRRH